MQKEFIRYAGKATVGLILTAAAVYFGWATLYPTYVCPGEVSTYIEWRKDFGDKEPKILQNKTTKISWVLKINRSELFINDDRFPFFKELNGVDNFAKKTQMGFEGGATRDMIQKYDYKFSFNRISDQLTVTIKGEGPHITDDGVGRDKGRSDFIGRCEKKWF